jgi:hypothetical protein
LLSARPWICGGEASACLDLGRRRAQVLGAHGVAIAVSEDDGRLAICWPVGAALSVKASKLTRSLGRALRLGDGRHRSLSSA